MRFPQLHNVMSRDIPDSRTLAMGSGWVVDDQVRPRHVAARLDIAIPFPQRTTWWARETDQ